MVNYKCPRCGYFTHIKTIYIRHLGRKVLCKPVLSNNILQDEYVKYEISEKIQNESKMDLKPLKITKNHKKESKMNPFESTNSKKTYICKFCDKEYSTNSNLSKHLKRCKEKLNDDEDKKYLLELVDKLNQQLEKKDRQIDELIKKSGINIGTQNNFNQNIQILAHNNTDLSHLTDNDYLKCLKHSNFCIPHLIEKIHFNPKKPENHNIYISNLKNNYVMIYNGNKWMLNDREESIQNLIDEKESIIEQKLEEWLEIGKQYPDIMNKFNRYLEKKENNVVLNKIKDEIKLMLFNNRDLIAIK